MNPYRSWNVLNYPEYTTKLNLVITGGWQRLTSTLQTLTFLNNFQHFSTPSIFSSFRFSICCTPGGTITKSPDGRWYIVKDVTKSKESIGEMNGYPLRGLKYVGEESPIKVIPAGTLVRLSLARWWRPEKSEPNFEERCYLQLSGWY